MRSCASLLLLLLLTPPVYAQNGLAPDWKRAIWRAPLHVLYSLPVTAVTFVIPPVGEKYIAWRTRAEAGHVAMGTDTPQKATIDLYTQTALPRRILKLYRVKVQ